METLVPILIPSTFVLALVVERLFPARELPVVRGWLMRGFLFFIVSGAIHTAVPAVAAAVLAPHAPIHLSVLGTVPSALAAFLISDFANYVLHRALHRSERLWRWSHQLHHSAERVDAAGFSFSHPVDSVLVSLVGGVIVAALGVTPSAGALTGLLGYLCTVFQHLNVRTPRFIGYLVQRPESHSVHHARGVHAYNYGNVPLWDILFGTFRNPASFAEKTGFWDGASTKISAMLLGRDVSEPEPGR